MQSTSLHLSPTSHLNPKVGLRKLKNVVYQRAFMDSTFIQSSPTFMPLLHVSHRLVGSRSDYIVARATSLPESECEDGSNVNFIGLVQSLKFGAMFATWYLLSIYFNIINKQVLQVYPFPATITAIQLGCGSLFALLMWALNLHIKPKITYNQVYAVFPLAIAHAAGTLLTNISLGKVAVSFAHTIKAMEPFFTVVLSALFLGQIPSLWVISSLIPIVGGVALASMTEASFNWTGFCSVMMSNLVNQSRNVFSKKLMSKTETLDDINLFSVMTIMSFLLLVPAAILIDGIKFTPFCLQYAADGHGQTIRLLSTRLVLSALCLHYYQQVSYTILHKVSPVTHSIGSCLKRVAVIVSSIVFFRTPVSSSNSLGIVLALVGVFLYTRARRVKPTIKAT